MPRKTTSEDIDVLEAGRMAGLIKRKDPELFEALKQMAKEKGMTVSELLVDMVRQGIMYDKYAQIDGKTIMLTLDILDRIYSYMEGWRKQTTLLDMVDTVKSLEEITRYFGPMIGMIPQEELPKIQEELKKRLEQEIIEKYSKTGRIGGVIDKLVDKIVDNIAKSVIEKLEKSGTLEDIAKIAEQAIEEAEKSEH